jgi:uncharacterized protein (DUF1499 family)
MSRENRRAVTRFLRQAVAALLLGTVAALIVTVPLAGWTTNDITTGQAAGYPDLTTRRYDMSVDNTTIFAAEALRRTPGGEVKQTDPTGGRVVGQAWVIGTPFHDDIEITVAPENGHAVVSIHSHSRFGFADFGVNAARIRSIQALMDDKLPRLF